MYPKFWTNQKEGYFLMKYTAEFKLECVQKYMHGEYIQHPPGVYRGSFLMQVRTWAKWYENLGFNGLRYKGTNKAWTSQERFALVAKVLAGHSLTSVAKEACINSGQLYSWVKKYQEKGLDGLECRKGRKPKEIKMSPKKKVTLSTSEIEELKLLRERNEYLEMENEYLKKLDALIAQKEAKQPKAKKRK